MVEQMLFSIRDEAVEETACLCLVTKCPITECCVEDLVGLSIVVVERSRRFGRPFSASLPCLLCCLSVTQ